MLQINQQIMLMEEISTNDRMTDISNDKFLVEVFPKPKSSLKSEVLHAALNSQCDNSNYIAYIGNAREVPWSVRYC